MTKATFRQWMVWAGVLALLALQGCTTTGAGFISRAEFTSLDYKPDPVCDSQDPVVNQGCTAERRKSLAFAPMFDNEFSVHDHTIDTVYLQLHGSGICGAFSIDFGDGTAVETFQNRPIYNNPDYKHTYAGWPGRKIARVRAGADCTGDRDVEVLVGFKPDGRDEFRLGFVPSKTAVCQAVPNVPPLRPGTVVRITTNGGTIKYGLPVFNASGDPNAVTPSNYPFTDRRMFSVVYRVGTDTFQGEVGPVLFRVTQRAPLEICVNDHPTTLSDNSGGMLLIINVNEGSATGP